MLISLYATLASPSLLLDILFRMFLEQSSGRGRKESWIGKRTLTVRYAVWLVSRYLLPGSQLLGCPDLLASI